MRQQIQSQTLLVIATGRIAHQYSKLAFRPLKPNGITVPPKQSISLDAERVKVFPPDHIVNGRLMVGPVEGQTKHPRLVLFPPRRKAVPPRDPITSKFPLIRRKRISNLATLAVFGDNIKPKLYAGL
jgi:hypothetical protein